MSATEDSKPGARSDHRIPKLRTRGRANRERLLAEAERLIAASNGKPIRFSDVFQAAGVSRGSAYRIYSGIGDLLQDLSGKWISDFVTFIRTGPKAARAESWMELSDRLVERASEYWIETEQTLQVLPRVRINAPDSYRQAVKELTVAVANIFDKHFVVPDIPDWLSVLALYIELGDTIYADAVRRDGYIAKRRLVEAQRICQTYLSFYLPESLPPR